MKTLYRYSKTGEYQGQIECHESELASIRRYTEIQPPEHNPQLQKCIFTGVEWKVEDIPQPKDYFITDKIGQVVGITTLQPEDSIPENHIEKNIEIGELYFHGIPRYYLKDDTITERAEAEIEDTISAFYKPIWDGEMFTEGATKEELDQIEKDRLLIIAQTEHKTGYGTIGLSFDSELKGQLERIIKKITQVSSTELIDIIYRNELREAEALSDFLTLDNFIYDDRELALGDKGRVYPYNLNEPSVARINIGTTHKRFIAISSLSIIVEKGYVPGETLFIWAEKGGSQFPLIPFNTRPYTCFGYFDFESDFSGETTIGIAFNAGNFQDRAYISDLRVAEEV